MNIDTVGCGYKNGKELLGAYTLAQISFLQLAAVVSCMSACLAWRVADEESGERQAAEQWLRQEDEAAALLREQMVQELGGPGSAIRPEGNVKWVFSGVVAAQTYALLGWRNFTAMPPSPTYHLIIALNLLTILSSTLILHLGFFGRLIALYNRNFHRVCWLTRQLKRLDDSQITAWWNCRSFVLNEDLALDYDMAGLAVSATFLGCVFAAVVVLSQTSKDGFVALLEPPGSYCAYACLYITCCLIKIFAIATETYREQHRHIDVLHAMTAKHHPTRSAFADTPYFIDDNEDYGDTDALDIAAEESQLLSPLPSPSPGRPLRTVSMGRAGASLGNINAALAVAPPPLVRSVSMTLHLRPELDPEPDPDDSRHLTELAPSSPRALGVQRLPSSTAFGTADQKRHSIAEMMSQIRKYDPYPCILGIPVMPALFSTCKFYIFLCFLLMGLRIMVSTLRLLLLPL